MDPGARRIRPPGRARAPALFDGYLNARAAYTVDGFFLTGDTAALAAGRAVREGAHRRYVRVGRRERLPGRDPRQARCACPAWPTLTCSARPTPSGAAVPWRSWSASAPPPPQRTEPVAPQHVRRHRARQPEHAPVEALPAELPLRARRVPAHGHRQDRPRRRSSALYDQRIEVARVTLYRIRLPFLRPFKTAKGTLRDRESRHRGSGGPCRAHGPGRMRGVPDGLVPARNARPGRARPPGGAGSPGAERGVPASLRGRAPSFAACAEAAAFPLAHGALEPALWDLYGKIVGQAAVEAHRRAVRHGGAAAGHGIRAGGRRGGHGHGGRNGGCRAPLRGGGLPPREAEGAPGGCAGIRAGGARGVSPTHDHAGREPELRGARLRRAARLRRVRPGLDRGAARPAAPPGRRADRPVRPPCAPAAHACMRLSAWTSPSSARPTWRGRCSTPNWGAMRSRSPNAAACSLRSTSCAWPQARGIERVDGRHVRHGRVQAPACRVRDAARRSTRPATSAPLRATSPCDVTDPPYTAERGTVTLNRAGHPHGLGCDLNRSSLADVLVDRTVIERQRRPLR